MIQGTICNNKLLKYHLNITFHVHTTWHVSTYTFSCSHVFSVEKFWYHLTAEQNKVIKYWEFSYSKSAGFEEKEGKQVITKREIGNCPVMLVPWLYRFMSLYTALYQTTSALLISGGLISRTNLGPMGHVDEYPTMHYLGNPRHTQSVIA